MTKAKDFMTTSATHITGKILICGTCIQDLAQEKLEELSEGRQVYSFCPELNHTSLFGYKLSTILRTGDIESIIIFIKDGSPHCEQILTTAQETAENTGFDKSKIKYYVTKKGKFVQIHDKTIRKSRNIMEIEELMKINKLYKTTKLLRGKNGCPNDGKETFESILSHLKEELQELEEGLNKKDWKNVQEELGDLLYNIKLFSEIANEKELFDFPKLCETTANKMIKNHKNINIEEKLK